MRKALACFCIALLLSLPVWAVKAPKGFDGKVYNSSVALVASSKQKEISDRFICTAEVVKKVDGGYMLLSAGHCTPANDELPEDMTFKVQDDLGQPMHDVFLLKAEFGGQGNEYKDYSLFYYPTDKKYNVLELGDEKDATVGDKIVDVDFSLGTGKWVNHGVISSQVLPAGQAKGLYGVDMFSAGGSSGSAIVSEESHKVIGILVAGWRGATMPALVEPISRVKADIENIQIKKRKADGQLMYIEQTPLDLTKDNQ